MFLEYGDDSVAQLGGVHLACEQASNLLTKMLEWGRLMAYLEQSTRYIPYDIRLDGRLPLPPSSRGPRVRFGARYVADMDALFDAYARASLTLSDWARTRTRRSRATPTSSTSRRSRPRRATRRAGCSRPRRCRTSGSTAPARPSRRCCCACVRIRCPRRVAYAAMMLDELRKVIPSFLTRVDRPDRGGAWSAYLEQTRAETHEPSSQRVFADDEPEPRPR